MSDKKSIIGTIKEGFAESTRTVHKINKENIAAVKADAKTMYDEVTTPSPGFVKFKEAKGVGNKAKVVVANIKESAAEASEIEKERRADIQSHEAYKTILEMSRAGVQKTMNPKYKYYK